MIIGLTNIQLIFLLIEVLESTLPSVPQAAPAHSSVAQELLLCKKKGRGGCIHSCHQPGTGIGSGITHMAEKYIHFIQQEGLETEPKISQYWSKLRPISND